MTTTVECRVCGKPASVDIVGGDLFLRCPQCGGYPVEEPSADERDIANIESTKQLLVAMREGRSARLRRNSWLAKLGVPYTSFMESQRAAEVENSLEEGILLFLENPKEILDNEEALAIWYSTIKIHLSQVELLASAQIHLVQSLAFACDAEMPPTLFSDVMPPEPNPAEMGEDQIADLVADLFADLSTTTDKPEEA